MTTERNDEQLETLESLLTPDQLAAVMDNGQHSLILAGAGSGKTRVLVYKIVRLIVQEIAYPEEIFAVTFTNKAAGEMRERAEEYLGYPVRFPWMGTFHSICVRLMRRWLPQFPTTVFRSRQFSIYDDDDSRKVVSLLLKEPQYQKCGVTAREICRAISNWKSGRISPRQAIEESEDYLYSNRVKAEIYRLYEQKLQESNALDFDDLLLHTVELLERDPQVLGAIRNQIRHIFVDEYQDTNAVQYRLIQLLTGGGDLGLTVVGDDDQSIYGWRGADVEILRRFVVDFPAARIFKLQENFRSSSRIVESANALIRNNRRIPELEKELYSNQPPGELLQLYRSSDDVAEARDIVTFLSTVEKKSWNDCAVFYRTNAQSRSLEKAFTQAKVPFRIYGGVGFYQRKEIKDLFAYLTLLINPNDEGALRRIINVPRRGIGDTSLLKLTVWAAENRLTLMEALPHGVEVVGGRAGGQMVRLHTLFQELAEELKESTLPQLVESTVEKSGYRQALLEEGSEEAADRVGNIDELINDVYERADESPWITLQEFVAEVALATDADRTRKEDEAVVLMTFHAAKGLEFDFVVLAGCEAQFLPLQRPNSTPADVEEERRLMYVGMTRARKRLWLTTTRFRRHRGIDMRGEPSPFIAELKREHLHCTPSAYAFGLSPSEGEPTHRSERLFGASSSPSPVAEFDHSFSPEELSQENLYLAPGRRVRHPRFGVGRVLSASGDGPRDRVTIRFDDGNERCLILEFANLSIIG